MSGKSLTNGVRFQSVKGQKICSIAYAAASIKCWFLPFTYGDVVWSFKNAGELWVSPQRAGSLVCQHEFLHKERVRILRTCSSDIGEVRKTLVEFLFFTATKDNVSVSWIVAKYRSVDISNFPT